MNYNFSIDKKYYYPLSKIFTPIVMDHLVNDGYSKYFNEVLEDSGLLHQLDNKLSLRDFLDVIYSFLQKRYRNEYFFKNEIINKILLGRHTLNTARVLTEFRIANSKADVVIFNGTSNVYEIKTKYDTCKRLVKQLACYMEVFDFINVVASEELLFEIDNIAPQNVGILVLTKRGNLSVRREPVSNKLNVKTETILNSLRKDEYSAIIEKQYGHLPNVPNTKFYAECKELFNNFNPCLAHDEMVKQLYERNDVLTLKDVISKIPLSLRAYIMRLGVKPREMSNLIQLLNCNVNSILVASR